MKKIKTENDTNMVMTADDVRAAIRAGRTICKHADPIEGSREDLTLEEALDVMREDASLIYVAAID